ncbi:helix-turn-helix domain-containing protein [Streptomyces exfoliatus]|uniref:helix-turn-helix domain-containing protein n=1 Tax=Streptomyces exfoliatus TaxID=1905 RepID=UPI0037B42EFC
MQTEEKSRPRVEEGQNMGQDTPAFGKCRRCGIHIPHMEGRPGRKPEYCGTECRSRAQRERDGVVDLARPRTSQSLGRFIAEDLQSLSHALLTAEYEGADLAVLMQQAALITKEVDYYVSAAVRDAKASGVSWAAVAKAAGVSIPTARSRWGEAEVERRMKRRSRERAAAGMHSASAVGRSEAGGDGPEARARERAHSMLSDALSHLHARSGLSIRVIAERTQLSSSYISRILKGERVPAWEVVGTLAKVFDCDPDDLVVLWELAQGMVPPAVPSLEAATARLHATLRGLHLAAGSPGCGRVAELSGGLLTSLQVQELLRGEAVPTWETTGAYVKALRAWPADVRPLWEAVAYAFMHRMDAALWESGSSERPSPFRRPGPLD